MFNGLPQFISFIGDMNEVILEVIVLFVEFEYFLLEETDFLKEFFLFVLQILLVSVIVYVFGKQLLDMFLLFENGFVFFQEDLREVDFMSFEFTEPINIGMSINFYFGDHLLEILEFFLLLEMIVFDFVEIFSQFFTKIFFTLQLLLQFLKHLGLVNGTLLTLLFQQLIVVDYGIIVILFDEVDFF